MSNHHTLIQIETSMQSLAADYAAKIGWGRSAEKLLDCLHCVQGCHYNRFPNIKKEFWEEVRLLLIEQGVNPEPIWKAMDEALATKDWKTNIAFTQQEFLAWVQEQINTRPDQP